MYYVFLLDIKIYFSYIFSFLSGITFLGSPTEVYFFGTAYLNVAIGAVFVCIITIHVFLPIFFKLQLSCTNEYLELRFSKNVRKLSSIVYLIGLLAVTSVIIYVPALAFSQVTEYSVHAITPLLTIICITYTSMASIIESTVENHKMEF
jgi:sodium-coupled monocarboxylate transporter 8/12